jgi:hypothetical protein
MTDLEIRNEIEMEQERNNQKVANGEMTQRQANSQTRNFAGFIIKYYEEVEEEENV